ncbi:MAG: hypothetical protein U0641_18070 [Anaerolineae bacterium]
MSGRVKISLDRSTVDLMPGEKDAVQATIRNLSEAPGEYRLQIEGVEADWASLQKDQVGLLPGDSDTTTLHVCPPIAAAPATYHMTVSVISKNDANDTGRAALDLTVLPPPPPPPPPDNDRPAPILLGPPVLSLSASAEHLIIPPGGKDRVLVTLNNAGGARASLQVSVQGPPAQWVELNPRLVDIAPGQTQDIAVSLSPGRDAPLGIYPMAVLAEASEAALSKRIDLVLEVGDRPGLVVALTPERGDGQAGADFTVRVSSARATPTRVSLSASDDDDGCSYTFDPSAITLTDSGSQASRLTVRPRRGVEGASRPYTFTVIATPEDGALGLGQAVGRYTQLIPPPPRLDLSNSASLSPDQGCYVVRLANPSQIGDTFQLGADEPVAACDFAFDPPRLTVASGGEATAILTITPRDMSSDRERVRPFTVHATPASPLLSPAETSGQFTQPRSEPLSVTLDPLSKTTWSAATFDLLVKNPRSAAMDVEFAQRGNSEACALSIKPPSLQVAPHGEARARVTVRPTPLARGETRRTTPFTVEMRAAGVREPLVAVGSLIQVPNPWWPRMLLLLRWLLIIGLAAAVIYGGYRLLPSVVQAINDFIHPPGPPPVTATPTRPAPTPTSTPIVSPPLPPQAFGFAACGETCRADLSNTQKTFPDGTREIFTRWSFQKLPPGAQIERTWSVNGQVYVHYACQWDQGGDGVVTPTITARADKDYLPSGTWVMTAKLNGQELTREPFTFTIEGDREFYTAEPRDRATCFGN